jgi:hypothetical protein
MHQVQPMLTLLLLFATLIALWGGLAHRHGPGPADQPGADQPA